MNIINTLPFPVIIDLANGEKITIPSTPKGFIAPSVVAQGIEAFSIDGIPVEKAGTSVLKNMPEPQNETFVLCNGHVLGAAKLAGRADCLGLGKPQTFDSNGRPATYGNLIQ